MCHQSYMEFGEAHPKKEYIRGKSMVEAGILCFQFCCS